MQQIISQYTNDTTWIIKGEEENLSNVVNVLQHFLDISGLELNWKKSMVY